MNPSKEILPAGKATVLTALMTLASACTSDNGPYVDNDDTYVATDDTDVEDTSDTVTTPTECSDGIDNDGNGVADANDTNCYGSNGQYDAARTAERVQQCRDGLDNDGDGLIDSADMGQCPTGWSDLEAAECNDGLDNDNDGWTDSSDAATGTVSPDPQCVNQYDISETEAGAQYPAGLESYYEGLATPDTGNTTLLLNTREAIRETWQKVVDLRVS